MSQTEDLPATDELAASPRRVVDDQQAETLYDSKGAPVAILSPIADEEPRRRETEQFLELMRSWRHGDHEQQRTEWEQLATVLAEERDA
jgi:alanyl-tRNA synthetase